MFCGRLGWVAFAGGSGEVGPPPSSMGSLGSLSFNFSLSLSLFSVSLSPSSLPLSLSLCLSRSVSLSLSSCSSPCLLHLSRSVSLLPCPSCASVALCCLGGRCGYTYFKPRFETGTLHHLWEHASMWVLNLSLGMASLVLHRLVAAA